MLVVAYSGVCFRVKLGQIPAKLFMSFLVYCVHLGLAAFAQISRKIIRVTTVRRWDPERLNIYKS